MRHPLRAAASPAASPWHCCRRLRPVISHSELKRIAGMRSNDGVLSVYVKIDPQLRPMREQAAAKFKGALTRFLRTADAKAAEVVARERDRVLQALEGRDFPGRSLASFRRLPPGSGSRTTST
jgi:hypothetical protein